MIELGQTIPAVNLSQLSDKGMQTLTNNELFTDKKLCYLRCLVLLHPLVRMLICLVISR